MACGGKEKLASPCCLLSLVKDINYTEMWTGGEGMVEGLMYSIMSVKWSQKEVVLLCESLATQVNASEITHDPSQAVKMVVVSLLSEGCLYCSTHLLPVKHYIRCFLSSLYRGVSKECRRPFYRHHDLNNGFPRHHRRYSGLWHLDHYHWHFTTVTRI